MPDPEKDALDLRADIYRFASAFCVPIAVATVGFLLTSDSGTEWVRGLLAAAAILFAACGAFCIFALGNTAHSVSRSNYRIDRAARFSLRFVYVLVAVGLLLLLVAMFIHLGTPGHSQSREAELLGLVALLSDCDDSCKRSPVTVVKYSIGPFEEASHDVAASSISRSINEMVLDIQGALELREIQLVLLIGVADKRQLRADAGRAYGSNLGLAQARASAVRQALEGRLVGHLSGDRMITFVAGPEHLGASVGQEGLASDRRVSVWVFFGPRQT